MKPKKNYKFDKLLIALSIVIIIAFILMLVTYITSNMIFAIIGSIICIIELFVLSFVMLFTLKDMTITMIDDYKNKHSLLSGALCIILITFTSYLLFNCFDNIFYKDNANEFNSIANTILSLTPALLSLMGVHYSNMIQESRRKEDFKIANTPCPLIECYVEKERPENKGECAYINVTIKNLADNILIPISIGDNNLNYLPVTKNISREFKDLRITLSNNPDEIFFVYQDTLKNIYKTKLHIRTSKEYQGIYTTIKNDEPVFMTHEDLKITPKDNCNQNDSCV